MCSRAVPMDSLLTALTEYQKKGVGVDMLLKSVLGVFRLLALYSHDTTSRDKYANLVDAIIDCRMLCNFGRPAITAHQGLAVYRKGNPCRPWQWHFLCLSYLFRVPEQLSGDLGYLQKNVFRGWSRPWISFHYQFFKSLSLTFALLSELVRRPSLRRKVAQAATPDSRLAASQELKVNTALIVRSLCDMYVYYKWLPFYTPIRTLEYVLGSVSGLLGVWMVWKDVYCNASRTRTIATEPFDRPTPLSGVIGADGGEGGSGGE